MKLVQFSRPGLGLRVGLLEGPHVIDLTTADDRASSTLSLIALCVERRQHLEALVESIVAGMRERDMFAWSELEAESPEVDVQLEAPIHPPEVWGFGVTYRRSAEVRDEDTGKEKGIYDYVYSSPRPEIFFKATASRCVGPNGAIGIRRDSQLTAVEPELAYVLGEAGEIVGYTVCNDVSAWDIERENPLYLPQSKIFHGCCALGPVLATPSDVPNPYELEVRCTIIREGQTVFEDRASTSGLRRTFEELNEYLYRDNPIPPGTVVSTGTGIMVPNEWALRDGDRVEIEIGGIGKLVNIARSWP